MNQASRTVKPHDTSELEGGSAPPPDLPDAPEDADQTPAPPNLDVEVGKDKGRLRAKIPSEHIALVVLGVCAIAALTLVAIFT